MTTALLVVVVVLAILLAVAHARITKLEERLEHFIRYSRPRNRG